MDFTPLRIRLPFGSEEEFIARYGVHVGRDGFFLATKSPKDVGAQLAFELVLADGTALLSGDGVVARTVAGARSGMVVRFLRLDGAGAALVERILTARKEAEGKSAAEATTWHGDPTRDVARVTGPAGASLPGAEEKPAVRPAKGRAVPADEAPTWPGDPTRDVVRFAPAGRALQPNGPRPETPEAPAEKKDVPFHLRPTPAVGIPETHAAPQPLVHTAVTPVRGIPTLGPEVVAFLSGRTPTVKTEAIAADARVPVAARTEDSMADTVRTPAPRALREPSAETVPPPEAPAVPDAPPVAAPSAPDVVQEDSTALAQPEVVPRRATSSDAIPLPSPATAQPRASAPPAAETATAAETAPAADAALVQATRSAEAVTEKDGPVPPEAARPASSGVEAGLAPAVLGLHLGTTSARMAWVHEGRVDVLPPDAGGGAQALLCRLVRDAHGVLRVLQPGEAEEALWVGSPVALLGTHADSPNVRTLVRRWPVPLQADERGEVAFNWGGVTVTAVELVATLLRSLRGAAERRTGRPCTQAVLVVPATFTLLQRARFREAAERAGLSVLRLLNAPTAAALAFAYDKGMARRRVLVWRMGAASSDAAVVAVSGNDVDVVSSGGDAALGGVNFDEQLALSVDKLARADPARLRARVAQAERCKQTLSTSEKGLVPPVVEGEPVIEVSRTDLELRTAALVERSVLLAQDVLKAAGLSTENLDALVLAGGMARLPRLRRAVETAFGKTAEAEPDAQAGASLGAALLGATLSAASGSGHARPKVVEVLAVPLEAVAPEFGHQRAFERNTRLPAEKTLSLVLQAGQPLEVQLFQGVARAPDPRSFLGLLQSPGVERPGEWALHLGLSADGLLQAAVTPPGGKRRTVTLQPAPAPAGADAATTEGDETDAGARLLGGLRRLFGKK